MKSDSHFHDPAAIKKQKPKEKPKDGAGVEWDFRAPCYDQRSGPWVNAGTHYGIANRQPVGREGPPKTRVPCMPFGRIPTMDVDEAG